MGAPRPDSKRVDRVMRRLAQRYDYTRFSRTHGPDPFRILIGCIISLRTKDEVTYPATERLFARISTPAELLRLRRACCSTTSAARYRRISTCCSRCPVSDARPRTWW